MWIKVFYSPVIRENGKPKYNACPDNGAVKHGSDGRPRPHSTVLAQRASALVYAAGDTVHCERRDLTKLRIVLSKLDAETAKKISDILNNLSEKKPPRGSKERADLQTQFVATSADPAPCTSHIILSKHTNVLYALIRLLLWICMNSLPSPAPRMHTLVFGCFTTLSAALEALSFLRCRVAIRSLHRNFLPLTPPWCPRQKVSKRTSSVCSVVEVEREDLQLFPGRSRHGLKKL